MSNAPLIPDVAVPSQDYRDGWWDGMAEATKLMYEHESTICVWTGEKDGIWNTGCGQAFVLNDDGPKKNDMHFCCFCGNKLEEGK